MNSLASSARRVYRSDKQVKRDANILEVTRKALAARGYDGVTMEDLAREAGVTKRTLYNLYGGKDQLLHAAVGEVVARYRGTDETNAPGLPAIIASRRIAVAEVIATPTYADAMTRALVQAPEEHPLTAALLRDSLTFTEKQLENARAQGALAPETRTAALAQQIVSQGWGMVLLHMKGLIDARTFQSASLQGLILLLLSAVQAPHDEDLRQALQDNAPP